MFSLPKDERGHYLGDVVFHEQVQVCANGDTT